MNLWGILPGVESGAVASEPGAPAEPAAAKRAEGPESDLFSELLAALAATAAGEMHAASGDAEAPIPESPASGDAAEGGTVEGRAAANGEAAVGGARRGGGAKVDGSAKPQGWAKEVDLTTEPLPEAPSSAGDGESSAGPAERAAKKAVGNGAPADAVRSEGAAPSVAGLSEENDAAGGKARPRFASAVNDDSVGPGARTPSPAPFPGSAGARPPSTPAPLDSPPPGTPSLSNDAHAPERAAEVAFPADRELRRGAAPRTLAAGEVEVPPAAHPASSTTAVPSPPALSTPAVPTSPVPAPPPASPSRNGDARAARLDAASPAADSTPRAAAPATDAQPSTYAPTSLDPAHPLDPLVSESGRVADRAPLPVERAAAPVPAPPIPLEWSAQIRTELAVRARELLERGSTEIRFTLDPPSLGKLRIRLEIGEGRVAAHLVASSAHTAALLDRDRAELVRAFDAQGIDDVRVTIGSERDHDRGGARDFEERPATGGPETIAHPSNATRRTPAARSLVDLVA